MIRCAYLVFCLPWAAAWLLFFKGFPRLHSSMLLMSALSGLAGPISEFWHRADYWRPEYGGPLAIGPWRFGIEDYLLTFAMAGVSMALFEIGPFGKALRPLPAPTWKTLVRLDVWGNLGIVLMILGTAVLHWSSIHTIMAVLLVMAAAALATRPEW